MSCSRPGIGRRRRYWLDALGRDCASHRVELVGDASLERRELDKVGVALRTEIDGVRIDLELQRSIEEPEVEQADAGDVAAVRQRLERGDRRVTGRGIGRDPVDHPTDLVAA